MARAKITREVKFTVIEVLGVNSITGESENREYTVAGELKPEKLLSAAIEAAKEDTDFHPAVVVYSEVRSEIRGMYVDDFIANSFIVNRPPSQLKNVNSFDGGEE